MNEIEWLPWRFSLFQGGFTTVHPCSIIVNEVSQLEKMFLDPPWRHQDFPKKKLPCWSPALYKKGATRANGNGQFFCRNLAARGGLGGGRRSRYHSQMTPDGRGRRIPKVRRFVASAFRRFGAAAYP